MGVRQYRTTVIEVGRGRVVVPVPFDPDQAFGPKLRHHVTGTVNGMGVRAVIEQIEGGYGLALGSAWRRDCGVSPGDDVEVSLAPEGPQRGDLPADLAAALADNPAAPSGSRRRDRSSARGWTQVQARTVTGHTARMDLEFSGEMWFWKGPAPFHFITVPEEPSAQLAAASASVTYGWGMIPVSAQIGATEWTTSLFPKDGQYIVPVKASVQKAEGLEIGDLVKVRLVVDVRPAPLISSRPDGARVPAAADRAPERRRTRRVARDETDRAVRDGPSQKLALGTAIPPLT
jgi:Domain of unknown function (DUF1905)